MRTPTKRPSFRSCLVTTLLTLAATQSALTKPPEKARSDAGFVGAKDVGEAANLISTCQGQEDQPHVEVPKELEPFVPAGTLPTEWRKGDLNLDGRPDYILLVEKDCMDPTLMVIVRQSNGSLSLAASNSHVVMPRGEGGTSGGYMGTDIASNGGGFTVSDASGSGPILNSSSVTFIWSADKHTWVVKQVYAHDCEGGDCSEHTDTRDAGTSFASFQPY